MGAEGVRQGWKSVSDGMKKTSSRRNGKLLLRSLLLKEAATGYPDPLDPTSMPGATTPPPATGTGTPPPGGAGATATTGGTGATTGGAEAAKNSAGEAGAGDKTTGDSWFSGSTSGIPNQYLVGGGIGALGGLTLYHLLSDNRKRRLSGYLGAALGGAGVGAAGAGLYRLSQGKGLLGDNDNPGGRERIREFNSNQITNASIKGNSEKAKATRAYVKNLEEEKLRANLAAQGHSEDEIENEIANWSKNQEDTFWGNENPNSEAVATANENKATRELINANNETAKFEQRNISNQMAATPKGQIQNKIIALQSQLNAVAEGKLKMDPAQKASIENNIKQLRIQFNNTDDPEYARLEQAAVNAAVRHASIGRSISADNVPNRDWLVSTQLGKTQAIANKNGLIDADTPYETIRDMNKTVIVDGKEMSTASPEFAQEYNNIRRNGAAIIEKDSPMDIMQQVISDMNPQEISEYPVLTGEPDLNKYPEQYREAIRSVLPKLQQMQIERQKAEQAARQSNNAQTGSYGTRSWREFLGLGGWNPGGAAIGSYIDWASDHPAWQTRDANNKAYNADRSRAQELAIRNDLLKKLVNANTKYQADQKAIAKMIPGGAPYPVPASSTVPTTPVTPTPPPMSPSTPTRAPIPNPSETPTSMTPPAPTSTPTTPATVVPPTASTETPASPTPTFNPKAVVQEINTLQQQINRLSRELNSPIPWNRKAKIEEFNRLAVRYNNLIDAARENGTPLRDTAYGNRDLQPIPVIRY